MSIELVRIEREAWERDAAGFADANYRQGWWYGIEAAGRVGAVSEHVACVRGGQVRALADVRVKTLPLVGGGVAYVNGGPLARRDVEEAAEHGARLREMIGALRAEYVHRRGMVLRVLGTVGGAAWNEAQDRAWREAGAVGTTMAASYRTMMVPLRDEHGAARSIEAVRAGLAQKWRNCLNKAEKQGVAVRESRGVEAMRRFAGLYEEFVARKGIHADHDASFFLRVQERSAERGCREALTVRLAEREGELLAGHVSSTLGDTCVYLLGATSGEGLKTNAAYLLQWDTIAASINAGLAWYDLGGIDPRANPGVHHFKDGMRGMDVTAPGPWEMAPRGVRGMMSVKSEKLYRSLRGRKKEASKAAKKG
ncbi:MAG: lipid II:glycine glycyltransferase FemX [Phycisphaerales bacterium]